MPFRTNNRLLREMPSEDFSIPAKYAPHFGYNISLKWSFRENALNIVGSEAAKTLQENLTAFFNQRGRGPFYIVEQAVGPRHTEIYAVLVEQKDYDAFLKGFHPFLPNPNSVTENKALLAERRRVFDWKPLDPSLEAYL